MSKYTPGPWRVTARANNMIDVIHSNRGVPGAITLALCRVQARQSWLAEAEANARLIAAAPTQHDALLAVLYAPGFEALDDATKNAVRNAIAAATSQEAPKA